MENLAVNGSSFCYHLDLKQNKVITGTYNFAALMEKQAALAKEEPQIGKGTVSEALLKELAGKYDPSEMSQDDYNHFIEDLRKHDILGKSELNDIGLDRVVLGPSHLCSGGIEPNLSEDEKGIHTIADANGNALTWVEIALKRCTGLYDSVKKNALLKVSDILNQIAKLQ